MPFLRKKSPILAFDNTNENSLSIIVGVPVLATQHLEIVPYTERVNPGVLQILVSQSSQRYCYPYEGSDVRGYSAAHTAVTAHDSTVPV